jgi:polyribonucleotide nucleotidyltransferase
MANNADLSLEDIARPAVTETRNVCGRPLTLSVGTLAPLTDGAVLARYGETVVLGTAVMKGGGADPDADFLALTVDHRDRFSASGALLLAACCGGGSTPAN